MRRGVNASAHTHRAQHRGQRHTNNTVAAHAHTNTHRDARRRTHTHTSCQVKLSMACVYSIGTEEADTHSHTRTLEQTQIFRFWAVTCSEDIPTVLGADPAAKPKTL